MIYSNLEVKRITIDDDEYLKSDALALNLSHKEIIQTCSQSLKDVIVVLDTNRGEKGNICEYFSAFEKVKK